MMTSPDLLHIVNHYSKAEAITVWVAECPRCKTKKCLIDEIAQRFYCIYCGLTGDKIVFIRESEGLSLEQEAAAVHLLDSGKFDSGKEE